MANSVSASPRVLVAMSGGVDSSVAAALCLQAGYDVTGVTLKLWGGPQDQGCCAVSDVDDARRVCQQLDIDHFVFNYAQEFGQHVVEPYVAAHSVGLTPNPCISCNRYLKFDVLAERARKLGFEKLVTGHHVRITDGRLRRGVDNSKDQSYVLYMLSAEDLALCEFPVGALTKQEVREQAGRLGLRTADKPESQDVCFITAAEGRQNFLADRLKLHAGELVNTAGEVVGSTSAVELVTIGQRKGLNLGGAAERRYAIDTDVAARRVTVGSKADLLTDEVMLQDHRWATGQAHVGQVFAQTSAHGTPHLACLDVDGQLRWDKPQERVAPGQAVVFYEVAADGTKTEDTTTDDTPTDGAAASGELVIGGATAAPNSARG